MDSIMKDAVRVEMERLGTVGFDRRALCVRVVQADPNFDSTRPEYGLGEARMAIHRIRREQVTHANGKKTSSYYQCADKLTRHVLAMSPSDLLWAAGWLIRQAGKLTREAATLRWLAKEEKS